MRKGFTLLEFLLGTLIFLLMVIGSLEFFGTSRRVFFRLRTRQENSQAAWAALDKIRSDVLLAGQGLARPIRLGLVSGFEQDGDRWILNRAEAGPELTADPSSGQTILAVDAADEDWAGKTICLFDRTKGEAAQVQSSGGGFIILASPLLHDYRAGEASAVVLRKTAVYLDEGPHILRRKADASPAQPLLEEVGSFAFTLDFDRCLASVRLELQAAPEKAYALTILARNAALGKRP